MVFACFLKKWVVIERFNEGMFMTYLTTIEAQFLQQLIQNGKMKSWKTIKNQWFLHGFCEKGKSNEERWPEWRHTVLVVFQHDLRYIRDDAGEERNMAKVRAILGPWRPNFGGLWRSPGTILMISEGIENCLEFHWIPWSGWLAPESSVPCQGVVKTSIRGGYSNQKPDCWKL